MIRLVVAIELQLINHVREHDRSHIGYAAHYG